MCQLTLKPVVNPMKHLLIEIPHILEVNTISKIFAHHLTHILMVISTKIIAKMFHRIGFVKISITLHFNT